MNRSPWTVIIGAIVLGLIVVAVSVFFGGGWALVLVETVGAGLAVALFLRGQREEDLEPGDQ